MRSREEIESLVKEKIENLSNIQKGVTYHITTRAGDRFGSLEVQVDQTEYPDMNIEERKRHLSDNFEETVRLTIAREVNQLLSILESVPDAEFIPQIRRSGIGEFCNFTIEDIKNLKLDDPNFIHANFSDLLQSIYESFGFENHLPTREEKYAKLAELSEARESGAKRSDYLRKSKEYDLMKHENGEGEFTLDGLPLELRDDCERKLDELIKKAEQREAEEPSKITGQELGQETLEEQKDSHEKQIAKEKIDALRAKYKEKDDVKEQ